MIVGEEAKSVEATLHNVLDHVPICAYSVCGEAKTSSDIIADFMLQRGVPGVFQDAAVDDRTEAMEKARVVALEHSCDYILMHDPDKMFYGRVEIPEEPYADAYLFRFGEGPCRLRLFSSQRRWAFSSLPQQGFVQEYAYCQSGPSVETDMPGDFYVRSLPPMHIRNYKSPEIRVNQDNASSPNVETDMPGHFYVKPPMYILNYKSPERRAKLERRMSWSGIKSATWCAGVEDPDRVWSYTRGHLRNIENFVENSTAEWGIFAEDDIILCPGFYDRVNQIDTNGFDVILLGYLLCEDPRHRPDIYPPVGKQLFGFPEDLWGAQCYMLRRAHAVHLLTTYTIGWALANPDQTFSSDFILTKRGRRALVFPPLVIEEGPDSEAESNGQNIFHRRCRVFLNRWVTDFEHMGAIERVIHLTWKDPNVTELPLKLVQSGLAALKRLNPTYEFRMHSDDQVEAYLRDKLSVEDYERIADRHIVEKVDLWRLLKIYHEGGVYCDIDRLVNIPLDAFLKPHHKFALPFYLDSDFSQDVMISASGNPIHKRAIELNLERRRAGETNLYMLGPITYFHAATECLLGYQLDRSPPPEELRNLKAALEAMGERVHTEREEPPFQTMLFKGSAIMDYEDAKMELYRRCGLRHWSGAW